jgi:hypothetical protein
MRFAKNSNPVEPSGCPHPVFRYIVDCGWHTLHCERCGDRWTLIGDRTVPRYDGKHDRLANHTPQDRAYDQDGCVPVPIPPGLRRQ